MPAGGPPWSGATVRRGSAGHRCRRPASVAFAHDGAGPGWRPAPPGAKGPGSCRYRWYGCRHRACRERVA